MTNMKNTLDKNIIEPIKEGSAFVREEIAEKKEKSSDPKTAVEGYNDAHAARNDRNEARVAQGKPAMTTEPGTTKKN